MLPNVYFINKIAINFLIRQHSPKSSLSHEKKHLSAFLQKRVFFYLFPASGRVSDYFNTYIYHLLKTIYVWIFFSYMEPKLLLLVDDAVKG